MKNALIFILIIALGTTIYFLVRKDRVGENAPILDEEEVLEPIDNETPEDLFEAEEGREITEEAEFLTIKAAYPAFGDVQIDQDIKALVQKEISAFKSENNTSYPGQTNKNSLEITYRIEKGDDFTAIVFSSATYTGGAHGNLVIKTLVYENSGEEVSIGSLFAPGSEYLSKLSEISRTKLKSKMGENLGAWADEGTSPTSDNFGAFYITGEDTLNIIFQPYQVAPWSAGVPSISIDLHDELGEILNQNIF